MKDLYNTLGIEKNATPDEVNIAYRRLARKLQPAGEQEPDPLLNSRYVEATEAYQILSSSRRRRRYDRVLKRAEGRRMYYFKLGYVNVAASVLLVVFTAAFGFYVYRNLIGKGKKAPAVAVATPVSSVAETEAAPSPKLTYHHKKIYHYKTRAAIAHAKAHAWKALAKVKHPARPLVMKKPETASAQEAKLAAAGKPQPVIEKSHPNTAPKPAPQDDEDLTDSYWTYLQANVTGIVSLHVTPSYQSSVIESIPDHSGVEVLSKGTVFYKISYNGETGYVPRRNIADP